MCKVSSGYHHTLALSVGGVVFSCGKADRGQLGLGTTDTKKVPHEVPGLEGKKIVDVAAGNNHNCVLSAACSVYTWGIGDNGRLGHGDMEDRSFPCEVDVLRGRQCCKIGIGSNHTLAVTDIGQLYTWGQGSAGQLGLGSDRKPRLEDQHTPQLCEYLVGKNIRFIAGGNNHTIVLTKIADQIETIVPSSLRALFQANSSASTEMNRVVSILLQASDPDQPADAVDGVVKEVKAGVEGMLLHASHHLLSRVYEMVEEHSVQYQDQAAEAASTLSTLREDQSANDNAMDTLQQRISLLKKDLRQQEEELHQREEQAAVLKRSTSEKTELLRAAEIKAERIDRALDRLNEADIPLADAWDQWQTKITEGDFASWSDQDAEVLLGLIGTSTWMPVFKQNRITPSMYSELTPAILRSASTKSFPLKFGDRCRFLMTIDSILHDHQPTIYGLPQPGEVNIADVSSWDVATVVRHFRTVCKLNDGAEALEREMVIGRVLLTMTDEDIINELKVEGMGTLMKMNAEIKKLAEYTRQTGQADLRSMGRFNQTAAASAAAANASQLDITYHLTSDRLVVTSLTSPRKNVTTELIDRRPTIITGMPVPGGTRTQTNQQPRKLKLKGNARRTIVQTKGNQSPMLMDQANLEAMNQRWGAKNAALGSLAEEDEEGMVSYEASFDGDSMNGYSPQPPVNSRSSGSRRQKY
jgi:hypothetical protein